MNLNLKVIIPAILVLAGLGFLFFGGSHLGAHKFSFSDTTQIIQLQPQTTTFFFTGDIMLSRNVAAKMYAANDFTLPFQTVASQISQSDLSFANLESPFNDTGDHSVDKSLVFNADPRSIAGLKLAGFIVLSTANNHSFDDGSHGIDYTYNLLKQNGITPIGTEKDCHLGQIIIRNHIKFGFLAYSYAAFNDGSKKSDPLVCDANDLTQVAQDIQLLRPQVDYLVISSHMGVEYQRQPSDFQVKFSHNAIDAGADLVIGNHPHWIEPVEQYKNGWIFYAMGNFVFDQMWSEQTREGLTATMTFKNKTLESIELKPVVIENYCCPRWATDAETKNILAQINQTQTEIYTAANNNK